MIDCLNRMNEKPTDSLPREISLNGKMKVSGTKRIVPDMKDLPNIWYRSLLEKSSLGKNEFVQYDYEQIKYKNVFYNGVKSKNFLYDDWQIITLERLFQNFFQKSLYEAVWHIQSSVKERFEFLVMQVERITGLKDFGIYLNKLLTIDALFVNEDRHMHNIAVLMNQKGDFAYCPIFDHGAGLLSDTSMDYSLGTDVYDALSEVRAKTISGSFEEQLDVSEEVCRNKSVFSFYKKRCRTIIKGNTGLF